MRLNWRWVLGLVCVLLVQAASVRAAIVVSGGGLTYVQQGVFNPTAPANLASGIGTPFSDGALQPGGQHDTPKLNDGTYGNANSWISDGDADGWAGISFGASQTISAVAFGRDNLMNFFDRSIGTYTLQYRNDGSTANDGGWTTIGTIEKQAVSPVTGMAINPNPTTTTLPSIRHGFNFTPVDATAVRLLVPVPEAGTAIDQIELYSASLPSNFTPQATVTWNGNNGDFIDQAVPTQIGGVPNIAHVTNGGVAFAASALQPGGQHDIPKLNDGIYGNANSWIAASGTLSFAGIDFDDSSPGDGLYAISSIAFSRNNLSSGPTDRTLGPYVLQYTLLTNADASTLETGDPTTGWATMANIVYGSIDTGFDPHLRHEFAVEAIGGGPLVAGAVRIVTQNDINSLLFNSPVAIDQIEVYGVAIPEPTGIALVSMALMGLAAVRRRRK